MGQFKRQVDGGLSTDNTYSRIMDTVGSLIKESVDIMKKEIVEINKAETLMNTARAEMSSLKGLLKLREDHQDVIDTAQKTGIGGIAAIAGINLLFGNTDKAWELGQHALTGLIDVYEHREKFDRVESDIL